MKWFRRRRPECGPGYWSRWHQAALDYEKAYTDAGITSPVLDLARSFREAGGPCERHTSVATSIHMAAAALNFRLPTWKE